MEDQNNSSSRDDDAAGATEEDFGQTRPSIAAYGLEDLCASTNLEDFDFEEDETSVSIRKPKGDEWFQAYLDASQRLTAFFIEVESGLTKVNYHLTSGIAKRVMRSDLSDDIKRKYLVPCINLDGGMFLWGMGLPLRAGRPKPNIRVTSRKVALKRDMATAMTNRVLCNGVTVSDVKSMNGLAVNTLPNSLNPMWH